MGWADHVFGLAASMTILAALWPSSWVCAVRVCIWRAMIFLLQPYHFKNTEQNQLTIFVCAMQYVLLRCTKFLL